jgi:hypothetical protein
VRETTAVRRADKAVGLITVAATMAALGLSYRNQLDFATQRGGYPVWAALVFPLMIDSFVVIGELRLFSATSRGEGLRIRAWAWLLTLGGLAASVAAGIAHVGWHAPAGMKLAAAVAPLAAAASLGTGLGIVKLRTGGVGPLPRASNAGTAVAAPPPRPARRQGAARSRARRPGAPAPELAAQWIADDHAARLPMGRRSFADRHGISVHHARVALAAASNGHPT